MVPKNDDEVAGKKDEGSGDSSKGEKKPPRPDHDPKMRTLFIGAEEEKEVIELVETQPEKENSDVG